MNQNRMLNNTPLVRSLLIVGGIIAVLMIFVGLTLTFIQTPPSAAGKQSSAGSRTQSSCTTPHHNPGESTEAIISSGLQRHFLVHLPPIYEAHALPLVISYHGYSWTPQMMKQSSHTDQEADKAGFVLVFPEGLQQTWNAGTGTSDTNDVLFTSDMLTYLEQNYCINAHRVYVTGFSLGSGMAYRVACDLSDKITAIATISGAYYPLPEGCHPAHPMSVMEIHGAADTLAPYNGNPGAGMAAVNDYLQGWLDRDQCSGDAQVFFQQGDVTGKKWTQCTAKVEVVHYRISDGQHTWPTTNVIDPNAIMWEFFNRFSL